MSQYIKKADLVKYLDEHLTEVNEIIGKRGVYYYCSFTDEKYDYIKSLYDTIKTKKQ